jgi:hypothetical protein
MSDEPAEPVELHCSEPGCSQMVTYQPEELPGVAYERINPTGNIKTITVYLECPNGHVRAYRIPA